MSRIFFIENPLMDISKEFKEDSILEKYNLQHGQACLASEHQMGIFKEIIDSPGYDLIPGGSTLNSCRGTNFMLKKPNVCTYFGCVGKDQMGDKLDENLISQGINSFLHRD